MGKYNVTPNVTLLNFSVDAMLGHLQKEFGAIGLKNFSEERLLLWATHTSELEAFSNLLFDALQKQGVVCKEEGENVNWQLGAVVGDVSKFGREKRYYYTTKEHWAVLWMTGDIKKQWLGPGGSLMTPFHRKQFKPVFVEFLSSSSGTGSITPMRLFRAVSEGSDKELGESFPERVLVIAYNYWKDYVQHLLNPITEPVGFQRVIGSTWEEPSLLDICRHWDEFRLAAWKELMGEKKISTEGEPEEKFMKLIAQQQRFVFGRGKPPGGGKRELRKIEEEVMLLSGFSCDNWEAESSDVNR